MDETTLKKINDTEKLKRIISDKIALRKKLADDLYQIQLGLSYDTDDLGILIGQYEAARFINSVEDKVWNYQPE